MDKIYQVFAVVMLIVSFTLLLTINLLQRWSSARVES